MADLPVGLAASQGAGSFPLSQLPLRKAGPILILFFLFFFFLLFYPVIWWVSCPFARFKVFCQHSVDVLCKSFYMEFFFFDVFVGEGEHHILLLHHLNPTLPVFKKMS